MRVVLQPTSHSSTISAERKLDVLIADFKLTGLQRSQHSLDIAAELEAAKQTIASMTAKTSALIEEKDAALTRANTLENAKESWQTREKALLTTIEDLRSDRKRSSSEKHLQARLDDTERMLVREISSKTSAEDELTRYRDVAQAQLKELRASEVRLRQYELCWIVIQHLPRERTRDVSTSRQSRSRRSKRSC